MNRPVTRAGLGVALMLSVLGLCLFADCTTLKVSHILGPALAENTAILRDPGTQWMVFACAGVYFLAFIVLRMRLAGGCWARVGEVGRLRIEDGGSRLRTALGLAVQWLEEPAFWLSGLLVLAVLAYGINYTEAVKATNALTLLGAAMVGQAIAYWESRKQKAKSRNVGRETVLALILLLAVAAVWQAEPGHLFQYRGQGRWTGPWDNPNTFGMLMGVGAVLAIGLGVLSLKSRVQSRPNADCGLRIAECAGKAGGEYREPNLEPRTSNIEPRTARWGRWVRAGLFGAAAGVMGVGLVKSYSRGAWVGTAVGLTYLFLKAESRKQKAEIGRGKAESGKQQKVEIGERKAGIGGARNWVAVAVVCASVGVLAFWGFRQAERGVVRRAYSVANANDFSWRNRVAAWEGALQMMAERPWFGFGWNQPERLYDQFYRSSAVPEGAAIQLNDYFILGTSLGVPALACFGLYVLLGLSPKSKVQCPKSGLATVCRAGALVLLVGFWFDGGLFKLATGAPFWILMELGRAGDHEIHEAHENE